MKPTIIKTLLLCAAFAAGSLHAADSPQPAVRIEALGGNVWQVQYDAARDGFTAAGDPAELLPVVRLIALPDEGEAVVSLVDAESAAIPDVLSPLTNLPDKPYTLSEVFTYSGIRFQPLVLHSDYLAKDGVSTQVNRFSIRIELPDTPPLERLTGLRRQALGSLVLNDDPPRRDPVVESTGGAWVYIVPDQQGARRAVAPLARWRELQGHPVIELAVPNWAGYAWVLESLNSLRAQGRQIDYVCIVGDVAGELRVPTEVHAGESDYGFGLLDGSDILPDAAVGRLSAGSIAELERIVAKILGYEQRPDLDDPGYLRRGAVVAGSALSGPSTIAVSQWVRWRMLEQGFTAVDTFWFTMGRGVASFLTESFGRGTGFINYRGWTGMEDWSVYDAGRLANRHPAVALLLACNTGDFAGNQIAWTEALLRAPGGAVGAIGSVGAATRVNFNNALLAGFYRGVLDDGIHRLGWALNRAKVELVAAYGSRALGATVDHLRWTNLMGDPATIAWTGVPVTVDLTVPNQVNYGAGAVQVEVRQRQGGAAIGGVRVGMFKAGELTAAGITGADGLATIRFDPRLLTPGQATFTASGGGVVPISVESELVRPARQLAYRSQFVLDDENFPRDGNNNGIANPFETIGWNLIVRNIGGQIVASPVTFTLASEDDDVAVRENRFVINAPIAPNGEATAYFVVDIRSTFPDRQDVPFTLTAASQDLNWVLPVALQGRAPRWSPAYVTTGEALAGGVATELIISLTNNGSLDVGPAQARLESLSQFVQIIQPDARYEAMAVGDTLGADTTFRILVVEGAPFASALPLVLHLESDAGYEADVPVAVQTMSLPAAFPTGPDAYGYYAISNTDENVNVRPGDLWLEINPRLGGGGTDTGLLDHGEDDDQSVVLDLPFPFQYYGREFNRLTVCTNGWAAFGDQAQFADFRNTPIGAPQGPVAQFCPWWEDLYTPYNECGVFYKNDTEGHRFIVEWYRMRRWIGPDGPGSAETFQIVLYDPAWHPTTTGDGDIQFNYLDITHSARVDGHGTPYPTIGIGNLDDRGGLQYGYWDAYAPGASRPSSGSGILFATATVRRYGVAQGTVFGLHNNEPVEGATVRTSIGGWARTDIGGNYRIANVPAGRELTLIVEAPGWNRVVSDVIQVAEGQEVVRRFFLTRPLLAINREVIVDSLQVGQEIQRVRELRNTGNGRLEFSISIAPIDGGERGVPRPGDPDPDRRRDDPDELWQSMFTLNASNVTGDERLLGAVFGNERLVVSGGNNGEAVNYLYRFNRGGMLTGRSEQPVRGAWGVHDLAYDGRDYYGGSGNQIYRMSANGAELGRIASPIEPPRALAVDPQGRIWTTTPGAPLHRLSPQGAVERTYSHSLRPYGLAWHPVDPDGCPLWVFSADGVSNLAISKMDTATGRIRLVTELALRDGDRAGGCELTPLWDDRVWALVALIQNPAGDRVEVIDAGPNLAWIGVAPNEGVLEPEGMTQVNISLSALQLRGGLYEASVVIRHNAAGDRAVIPVRLVVDPLLAGVSDDLPTQHSITSIHPNPANGHTSIRFGLPRSDRVSLTLHSADGRLVEEWLDEHLPAGSHQRVFDASAYPAGLYIIRISSGGAPVARKFVILK
ncbi:MAG: T9SS type A sorting domain-containing protein [Calditrichaeota bacterium]|nr:T9SS type A sorting domain-containing protein [Calditrichota bacterium]